MEATSRNFSGRSMCSENIWRNACVQVPSSWNFIIFWNKVGSFKTALITHRERRRFWAILRNASRTMKETVSPKIDGKADSRWISVVHDRHPPLPVGKKCCLCEGSPKTSVLSSAPNLQNSSKKKRSRNVANDHEIFSKISN